jgi:hypothetical protein
MKIFVITALVIISFLYPQGRKMKQYNSFRKEIEKDIFYKFKKGLPESYEISDLSKIIYAAGNSVYDYSGISIVYELNREVFDIKRKKLHDRSILKFLTFSDSTIKFKNEDYFNINDTEGVSIRTPNIFDKYCHSDGFCHEIEEYEISILNFGSHKIYKDEVIKNETLPKDFFKYSIGAYISKKSNNIIYWFLIY